MCLILDVDLYNVIISGCVEVVIDYIDYFDVIGIVFKFGGYFDVDIIVIVIGL